MVSINTILLLHPGAMGHAIGAQLTSLAPTVLWCAEGRSTQTRERAASAGLTECASLSEGLARADLVMSVCPPHAAVALAETVAAHGYGGLYLDANAIAPATVRGIATKIEAHGASLIDGGIIGPPPHEPGRTRLYLSGASAGDVAALFEGTHVEAIDVGPAIGGASAVKACYAAWTKGTSALLLAILALARSEQVEGPLREEWARSQSDIVEKRLRGAQAAVPKAWRFEGEMEEIASAFALHDLPDGFHLAAATLYERLAMFKDRPQSDLDAALSVLTEIRGSHA